MAAAKTALTLALVLALAACANGMLDQRSDLERTWDKAVIALPAEGSRPARMGTVEETDLAGYFASLPRGVRARRRIQGPCYRAMDVHRRTGTPRRS